MDAGNLEEHFTKKKRPSIFWWILAHLVAVSFAVVTWTTCLFLFNYPERPYNYEWLRKLGRLDKIAPFTSLEAPEGSSAGPNALYDKYARLQPSELEALNLYLLRNFITNYKTARFNTYVVGSYRVISSRPLGEDDFFSPGLVVTLQGYVQTEELDDPSAYPVFVDLMFPMAEALTDSPFEAGDRVELGKTKHRAAILHASKTFSQDEPAYHLTAVPLSYDNYRTPDSIPLVLSPPDPLHLTAPLPPSPLR